MGESFENADAWKKARSLAGIVYDLCARGLLAKDLGSMDQLQRAAVSVMNNIAEGWERLHAAEKSQPYNVARRSRGEVRSMSYVLLDNRYITPAEHGALRESCVNAGKLITGLIRSLGDR